MGSQGRGSGVSAGWQGTRGPRARALTCAGHSEEAVAPSIQADDSHQTVALVHRTRTAADAVGLIYSRKGQLRVRRGRRLPPRRRAAQWPASRPPRWRLWVKPAPGPPGASACGPEAEGQGGGRTTSFHCPRENPAPPPPATKGHSRRASAAGACGGLEGCEVPGLGLRRAGPHGGLHRSLPQPACFHCPLACPRVEWPRLLCRGRERGPRSEEEEEAQKRKETQRGHFLDGDEGA